MRSLISMPADVVRTWITFTVVGVLLFANHPVDGRKHDVGLVGGVSGSRDDEACSPDSQPKELTDFSGWFTSPNYPDNYPDLSNCQWLIKSQNTIVSLSFVFFNTERNYDFVTIYNGNSTASEILADFHGSYSAPPNNIISSGPEMLIVFTSDPSTSGAGFNATYYSTESALESDPCSPGTRPLVLREYSGKFQSKGFPDAYWNSANCQWLFVSQEPGGTVEINFDVFGTEVQFDYVRVYDGNSSSAPLLGSVHGHPPSPPTNFRSNQPYLYMQFTTDFTIADIGFNGTYTSVPSRPCGSNLHVSPADAIVPPNYDVICHLERNDTALLNTNCYDLVQDLLNIGNADALIAQGGNLGCYSATSSDFSDAPKACYDNYQWQARLGNCVTCWRLFVCIRYS